MDDTVPATRSRFVWIFIGDDGLRAGWSLVLFFALVLLAAVAMVVGLRTLAPAALQLGAGMTPPSPSIGSKNTAAASSLTAFLSASTSPYGTKMTFAGNGPNGSRIAAFPVSASEPIVRP